MHNDGLMMDQNDDDEEYGAARGSLKYLVIHATEVPKMWPTSKAQESNTLSPITIMPQRHKLDPATLRQWFTKMDKDSNGHISVVELQAALAEGGLNFSLGTTASIIRQCDSKRTGTITFDVFERLHAFLATVQDTFERMQPDSRTGRVSFEEVARTLAAFGYRLEPQVQDALFIRFDPLHARSMGIQEFMALTLFLRSATDTFKAFDPTDTGVVHLNFTQFLYAAVNSN